MHDLAPFPLDWTHKSAPHPAGLGSDALAAPGLNILAEDVLFPVAVLKEAAIRHNRDWMRRFLALGGASISPHGKTHMSPDLMAMQLDDGAWGMTAATAAHVRVYRRFGVGRVLMANQLVGRRNIAYVLDELRADPDFDFYCLVDSEAAVAALEAALEAAPIGRPFQVLLEVGMVGGRTGVRTLEGAKALARRVAASPHLSLRGVEAFEGVAQGQTRDEAEASMTDLVERIAAVARWADDNDLYGAGEVLLTAGGSSFFDKVDEVLGAAELSRPHRVVIRSGCYLTHDDGFYLKLVERLAERSPRVLALGPGLTPALELWAVVQSLPEPGRAIVGLGKRDAGFDFELPMPKAWARPGEGAPRPLTATKTLRMDDQHLYLDLPRDRPLQVGDLVSFGISHPCTTFDRWRSLYLVDDDYRVTGAVRTAF